MSTVELLLWSAYCGASSTIELLLQSVAYSRDGRALPSVEHRFHSRPSCALPTNQGPWYLLPVITRVLPCFVITQHTRARKHTRAQAHASTQDTQARPYPRRRPRALAGVERRVGVQAAGGLLWGRRPGSHSMPRQRVLRGRVSGGHCLPPRHRLVHPVHAHQRLHPHGWVLREGRL